MTFPQHKNKKSASKNALVLLLITLIAMIFSFFKPAFLENMLVGVASRLDFLRYGIAGGKDSEAAMLAAKVADLELEIRKLQGAASKEIFAHIKLGGDYIFSDFFYIDRGSEAGIKNGDIVLSENRIFAGVVTETESDKSKISPIGTLGGKLALRTGEAKNIVFTATGIGAGELVAELPNGAAVAPGDMVWLGENPDYQAGFIVRIEKIEGRNLQNIYILSPLPFRSSANVYILENL